MAIRTTTTRTIRDELGLFANTHDLIPATPSFNEVVVAYLDCRKNKATKHGHLVFKANLSENLLSLYEDLRDWTYKIGTSICFVVTNPTPREVWAADFRDRIVHHIVYNRISGIYHRSFSAASCACIPERGTLYGARRLEKFVRSASQNWSRDAYYLKMDISNFFSSIDKEILINLLEIRTHDKWTRWVIRKIIMHDPTSDYVYQGDKALKGFIRKDKSLFNVPDGKGLAIGNLSSQFFANVYMNVIDKFIDHVIKPMGYVRYVDDMVLIDTDKDKLIAARDKVIAHLEDKLELVLNPKKTILQPVSRGVDFVGFVILPFRTTPRRAILHKARTALFEAQDNIKRMQSANSYLGLISHSKSRRQRTLICKQAMRQGHAVNYDFKKVFA